MYLVLPKSVFLLLVDYFAEFQPPRSTRPGRRGDPVAPGPKESKAPVRPGADRGSPEALGTSSRTAVKGVLLYVTLLLRGESHSEKLVPLQRVFGVIGRVSSDRSHYRVRKGIWLVTVSSTPKLLPPSLRTPLTSRHLKDFFWNNHNLFSFHIHTARLHDHVSTDRSSFGEYFL